MNPALLNVIKNLSPAECITIAKMIKPNDNFEYIKSDIPWDGHDLVANLEDGIYRSIVQIDFSGRELPDAKRFRYYLDLYEYSVDGMTLKYIIQFLENKL